MRMARRQINLAAEGSDMFTRYQKIVIAALAFLQFTIILDFMIMSPLGALMIPDMKIDPSQFGIIVSAYALSAGLSGIAAAGFADRFDRKKLLMFFYSGFLLGTFLCGLAPSYPLMVAARIVTGIFGGVIGSIVFAMVTDLFPYQQRGRVMGILQTAFAASQVLGIPAGLYVSNHWGWHAPFLMIVAVGVLAGLLIFWQLEPVDAHLKLKQEHSALGHLWNTARNPSYIPSFMATTLLSAGGFMIMPFASTFNVNNLEITMDQLPMIYLVTGIASIFIGPLVGKYADQFGKMRMFIAGTILSSVMVAIYTNLGPIPLYALMIINVLMFVGIFSRMIPSNAMVSAIPDPAHRGSFMAITASLQQMAGGLGSLLAGLIVVQQPNGHVEHFARVGAIVIFFSGISWFLMNRIHHTIHAQDQKGGQQGDPTVPAH